MLSFRPLSLAALIACAIIAPLDLSATAPDTPAIAAPADRLAAGFHTPPDSAKLSAYWWWLNGNVTPAAITRDLTAMKEKGFGSVFIYDADGSGDFGNARTATGPMFASPAWRELYKHALREADRLGLAVILNIQSGWNLGGPFVRPEHAAKLITYSETTAQGPASITPKQPPTRGAAKFYRDIAVVAIPRKAARDGKDSSTKNSANAQRSAQSTPKHHAPLRDFNIKIASREFGQSSPDCLPLLLDEPESPGEEDALLSDVRVLKEITSPDGKPSYEVPAGDWTILRFGYTQSGARVSTSSRKWQGFVLDYLSPDALKTYWNETLQPLLDDAGPLAGKTLRFLHTDSWECGGMNWTPAFVQEFTKRRGYDPIPYLPVVAGKILDNRKLSNRFLNDFRRTIADCIRDNHYALLQTLAAKHNIGIIPESGGPHGGPFDSLQLLGLNDIPMAEFWSWSPIHRVGDITRFFLKQPASAAHVSGKALVAAEGFTNVGMHWQESFSDNLKPSFDQALCEGMNFLVWSTVICSPDETGMPGQEFFAGTHFNPKNFTFSKSQDFLKYINRSQFLLQQGLPFADVLEYYGENAPNFTQMKGSNTAKSLPDYNFDTAPEEALLTRVSVQKGKIVLPDGTNYKLLVLPGRDSISAAVLQKLEKWVLEDGLTVIGPKPVRITGLSDGKDATAAADAAVQKIADTLWGMEKNFTGIRNVGKGRVASGITSKELLNSDKLAPDFERLSGTNPKPRIDSIHRIVHKNQAAAINLKTFAKSKFSPKDVLVTPADEASGVAAHIYFVANLSPEPDTLECAFRVTGKQPELWDALTGERRLCAAYRQEAGRTILPLDLTAFGSVFVVFRESISETQRGPAATNTPQTISTLAITGPWEVSFSKKWGGPEKIILDELVSWDKHPNPQVRFYSGPAVYRKVISHKERSHDVPLVCERGTPAPQRNEAKASLTRSEASAKQVAPRSQRTILRLGEVSEIAEIRLNGCILGTVWARPYEIDITDALRPGDNLLEIEVVNHWANRLIGDAALPPAQRLTRTNIRKLTAKTPLVKSGLTGPVEIVLLKEAM